MNRYIQLDEILHARVISTTSGTLLNFKVIAQGHMGCWCFSVCVMLRLPVDNTSRLDLMILLLLLLKVMKK